MKSLNGLLFVVIGGLIIWIGATGRLPALAAALGMVRNAPGTGGTNNQTNQNAPDFSGVTSGSSSSTSSVVPGAFVTLKTQTYIDQLGDEMNKPTVQSWQQGLKTLGWIQ